MQSLCPVPHIFFSSCLSACVAFFLGEYPMFPGWTRCVSSKREYRQEVMTVLVVCMAQGCCCVHHCNTLQWCAGAKGMHDATPELAPRQWRAWIGQNRTLFLFSANKTLSLCFTLHHRGEKEPCEVTQPSDPIGERYVAHQCKFRQSIRFRDHVPWSSHCVTSDQPDKKELQVKPCQAFVDSQTSMC